MKSINAREDVFETITRELVFKFKKHRKGKRLIVH